MLEFNQGSREPMYISEKHNSNDIIFDIENIEHLEDNKERNLNRILSKIRQLNMVIKSIKCKTILKK